MLEGPGPFFLSSAVDARTHRERRRPSDFISTDESRSVLDRSTSVPMFLRMYYSDTYRRSGVAWSQEVASPRGAWDAAVVTPRRVLPPRNLLHPPTRATTAPRQRCASRCAAARHAMNEASHPAIYPRYCFHLSPTVNTWCLLHASAIHRLKQHDGFQGRSMRKPQSPLVR